MRQPDPRYFLVAALSAALIFAPAFPVKSTDSEKTIVIDYLSNIYGGVVFDHDLHDSYAACVECHHHVMGSPPSNPACAPCHRQGTSTGPAGCRSCHPKSRISAPSPDLQKIPERYHIDIPGLNGAYHLRCVSCHLAITAGPTGCLDCHSRRNERTSP